MLATVGSLHTAVRCEDIHQPVPSTSARLPLSSLTTRLGLFGRVKRILLRVVRVRKETDTLFPDSGHLRHTHGRENRIVLLSGEEELEQQQQLWPQQRQQLLPAASAEQQPDAIIKVQLVAGAPTPTKQAAWGGLQRKRRPLRAAARTLRRALLVAGSVLSPRGPGSNDCSLLERTLNVVTCLPFFFAGRCFSSVGEVLDTPAYFKKMLARRTLSASLKIRSLPYAAWNALSPPLYPCLGARRPPFTSFGRSLAVVGAVAALYHGSNEHQQVRGMRLRPLLRKLDYWTIAVSTSGMRAAAVGALPAPAAVAMAAMIPLRPTLVTGANLIAVEVHCCALVLGHRSRGLLLSWLRHVALSTAATAAFAVEGHELAVRLLGPLTHALWHSCAAAALATAGGMLQS